jgi:serine/threonine-protein kinase HipA
MNLAVHLQGSRIGTLISGTGPDFRFEYTPETVAMAGTGSIVLSESLPVQTGPFETGPSRAYFEGLLPESSRREEIARRLRVSQNDGFRLLAEIGRECAGAVTIVPEEEQPDGPGDGSVEWLSPEQLADLVDQLPSRPLGIDIGAGKLRLSLAGVQRKLALVREGERFGIPGGDTPSTDLVKPQYSDEYPDIAVNEMFCMSVAAAIGIHAARSELKTLSGRICLISHRFDREEVDDHAVRVHQEDLCQALGISPNLKYQGDGGPGFPEFRRLLERIGRRADVLNMVRAAVLNFTLGNSDAHGKNFAVLHSDDGRRLAPLYDVVSTAVYDLDDAMAMAIGDNFDPDSISLADWLDMSHDCDLNPDRFFKLVRETSLAVHGAAEGMLERSREEGWVVPVLEEIVAVSRRRSAGVAAQIEAR